MLIGKARNYKDGVSYGQIAVNGTPGNTQRDLERLCEIGPEANEKKPRTL